MSTIAATEYLPIVATADAARDSMVVSLHDVAPSTRRHVQTILSELSRRGVRVCSLLVVPDYHHEGLFTKDPEFVSWLRGLEADGHEIAIHGYFHERPQRQTESLRDKLVTRFYTQNEGEFYDLSYGEALRRIMAARDEFQSQGLKPRGFVAPAWLLGTEAERAASDAEIEYTTRLRTVTDLRSGNVFPARTLVYSVLNGWRRRVSCAWNATLFRLLRDAPLLRISIHPPDYSHSSIWRQITGLIEGTVTCRTATTYKEWLAQQRLQGGP